MNEEVKQRQDYCKQRAKMIYAESMGLEEKNQRSRYRKQAVDKIKDPIIRSNVRAYLDNLVRAKTQVHANDFLYGWQINYDR